MSIHQPGQIYYSFIHDKNPEIQDETYFDSSDFEWSASIEKEWKTILKEVVDYLQKNEQVLTPYFATDMMNAPKKWKAFSFYFWGLPMSKQAIAQCPKTVNILKKIPHIVSFSVSVLEPHSEIKPHYGDTDAVYRAHLSLVVPGGLPNCGFRVGYEDRAWEEGKLLIFNDAAYHKAWNNTDSRRVVLLFDLMKAEHEKDKIWICAKVRGGIIWQIICEKTGILKGKKNLFTSAMALLLSVPIYFVLLSAFRKSALLK